MLGTYCSVTISLQVSVYQLEPDPGSTAPAVAPAAAPQPQPQPLPARRFQRTRCLEPAAAVLQLVGTCRTTLPEALSETHGARCMVCLGTS